MNFSEANSIHGGLPQFAELTPKSSGELTSGMQQAQNIIYTTAAATMNHGKQPIVASHMQLQQQSAAMAEYLQKLQATTLPLTLQQLMKLQSDPLKVREKCEENEKNEQATNNILNIPSVPVFRNGQATHNGNGQYVHSENMMMEINPSDLNVHMEGNESSELVRSGVHTQTDSQTQTQQEKTEQRTSLAETGNKSETKKMKFRAKTGEIKIALGLDGSMLYCCPECSLAFSDKSDIEQHIQGHVQERKYQCKECGAMLKRKEHLDQHMRGHSDERPFKCPVCQKAFKRNEHLTRHYVIHSGDKNFTCNVCAKAFSRKDHLNKHAQTHLGVKRTKTIKKESPTTMDNSPKDLNDTNNSILSNNDDTNNPHPIKQEISFLQHIHHLQKDQNFIQTFSAFKEQALREGGVGGSGGMLQQQAVNMNEILPQNARYLMPSQLQS
ncbi:zinc finger protein 880-like isoform X2 [Venturia canescens]|uniref:zinc finger protein 880-like isoform X2 n=1 Tax=Venturia canescens TaxID=32260 RepID=UPI001C9C5710|nr:zinc finger protein 880-like isoform X2 [Venturia canescens]